MSNYSFLKSNRNKKIIVTKIGICVIEHKRLIKISSHLIFNIIITIYDDMQFIILYDVWIYLDLPTKEFILTLRFLYVPPSLIFKKNLCGARLALSVLYGSQN